MLELFQYIFSGFWIWAGTAVLLCLVLGILLEGVRVLTLAIAAFRASRW
jgi:hypothetical protein